MSRISEAAKRLALVYTEGATPEELAARMEILEQEQYNNEEEDEEVDYEGYGPSGHINPQLVEEMDQYFEELCTEVKKEYGTDLHKIYMEV